MAPIANLFQRKKTPVSSVSAQASFADLAVEKNIPADYHVYCIVEGAEPGSLFISAGNPATAEGSIFIRSARGEYQKITLPDETAFLTCILRLPNGSYVAGGMNAIGRGAILLGNAAGTEWVSSSIDLHAYSTISSIVLLKDGTLNAFTGQMITQGKTKPVVFKSKDMGKTWEREALTLPVSMFQSHHLAQDGRLFIGTSGDKDPRAYVSRDDSKTWEELPLFPGYKTYKMISTYLKDENTPNETLYIMLWGYKTEIADRVVRLYALKTGETLWQELPAIQDSHFIFSFLATTKGYFFAGSEKGKVLCSKDAGQSWQTKWTFNTNIGAQALYEDRQGVLWLGKDAIPPHEYAFWRSKVV